MAVNKFLHDGQVNVGDTRVYLKGRPGNCVVELGEFVKILPKGRGWGDFYVHLVNKGSMVLGADWQDKCNAKWYYLEFRVVREVSGIRCFNLVAGGSDVAIKIGRRLMRKIDRYYDGR